VYQEWINDWYETPQTAFGLKEGCIGKLDRCNDRKICRKLPVNKNVKNPRDINLFNNGLYLSEAWGVSQVINHLLPQDTLNFRARCHWLIFIHDNICMEVAVFMPLEKFHKQKCMCTSELCVLRHQFR
jgi:hypothetical protein